jgi:AcrR family transcriptional regulator
MSSDEKEDTLQVQQTAAKKELFIKHFNELHYVTSAARVVDVNPRTVYRWYENDPEFAAKMDVATKAATEDLECIAEERAKKFSDTLLIFLLKARDPERFKDRVSTEIDIRVIQDIVLDLTTTIKKVVPEFCPHCKTSLDVPNRLSAELLTLSKKFGKQQC